MTEIKIFDSISFSIPFFFFFHGEGIIYKQRRANLLGVY